MVRAIMEGRKTMTRRLTVRKYPDVGDRLWVRESLQKYNREPPTAQYVATITGVVAPPGVGRHPNGAALWQWKRDKIPSIHMPRWASRLTLEVTGIKTEPLQAITEADAQAEGMIFIDYGKDRWGNQMPGWHANLNDAILGTDYCLGSARSAFGNLWEKLHGAGAWHKNPEVVAISFRAAEVNIDKVAA